MKHCDLAEFFNSNSLIFFSPTNSISMLTLFEIMLQTNANQISNLDDFVTENLVLETKVFFLDHAFEEWESWRRSVGKPNKTMEFKKIR